MAVKIDITQVRKADVIVTTGNAKVSQLIRNATGGSVSHAMLYLGNQEVLESIERGVTRRSWGDATTADGEITLAIALRRKNMSESDCNKVIEAALKYKDLPYDAVGAAGSGMYGNRRGGILAGIGCRIFPISCSISRAAINENASDENADKAFFCSELVARAFTAAGYPIVDGRATDQTPRAIRNSSYLNYVGHLIDTPPK